MKSSLFGQKKQRRTPKDLATKSHLSRTSDKQVPCGKRPRKLGEIFSRDERAILHGDGTHDLDPKLIQELVDASMKENIPSMISQGLPMLEFEARKDMLA